MLLGMMICSVQDLQTYTVERSALILWAIGSVGCILIGNSYRHDCWLALLFVIILAPHMAIADSIAFTVSSLWFDITTIHIFLIAVAAYCVGLHKIYLYRYGDKRIPMMPAIALGWASGMYYAGILCTLYASYKYILLYCIQNT
jgi:hypothetical protein